MFPLDRKSSAMVALRFSQSRAVAIDMESATIAGV
jgi:nucleoside phosphorylase